MGSVIYSQGTNPYPEQSGTKTAGQTLGTPENPWEAVYAYNLPFFSGSQYIPSGVYISGVTTPITLSASLLGITHANAYGTDGYITSAEFVTFNTGASNAYSALQIVANSGTGVGVANSKIGNTEYLNSISGAGNVLINSPVNGVIIISGSQYTLPTNVTFGTVNASVISGTTISGNAIFASGVQIIPSNYQPVGNYVVSGSSTILNILDASVISGTTISGGSVYSNGVLLQNYVLPSVINAVVISGTTISGNAIYENGIHVPNSLSVSNNLTGNLTSGAITISGSLIPTFTTVNASVISGTTISGNSAFLGSLTVTGTETDGTINASVISGTTISGNNIYANNSVYIAGNPIGMQLIYSGAITNVSTVTISGLNSNTEYKLRFNNVHSGTAGTTEIRFNNDSSLRYAWTTFSATNGGTANNGNNSQAQILTQNFTNADGQSEMYEMNFSSPPNLSSGVSIYGSGLNEAVYNANIQISTFAGYYLSSSGVSLSSISLLTSAGQFKSGRILLYKMGA